jgi:hypothetical protein
MGSSSSSLPCVTSAQTPIAKEQTKPKKKK